MNNLLLLFILTIIVAAFFGMSIVLSILRSIPMNIGYHSPVATNVTRSESSGGGGLLATLFFLLLVGGLFWYMSSGANTDRTENQPPASEQEDQYFEQEDNNYRYQEEGYLQEEEEPKAVSETSPIHNLPPDQVNRSPFREYEQNVGTYGIQLFALKTYEIAANMAKELGRVHPAQVFTDTNDNYFKVIVIGFDNRDDANDYKGRNHLEGFVKELEGGGLVALYEEL